jgi:diaminohydroxyphosphoribosylaminopyrimidine deaminase/5-amino-6-(5-phosphoribosylamino)uracil reductase
MTTQRDLELLQQATRLAIRGHGGAEPNPMVGCVITNSEGAVVGSGYHQTCGEAHAEIKAIQNAGDKTQGGTAYITLEPCHHQGKTPPCTYALVESGIKKIVIGVKDPHHEAGGGAEFLERSGLDVTIVNDALCHDLVAPFVHRLQTGLPWVICKWAQTIDGCIEPDNDGSQWISSQTSLRMVHRERGRVDAIIVGAGTVASDNPSLTVRGATKRRTPVRVVIDPSLRSAPKSNIYNDEAPTLIAHAEGKDTSRFAVDTIALPSKGNALDLVPLLRHLATAYDATNVIIEGGATTLSHVFDQCLANELWVFTAPHTATHAPKINMNDLVENLSLRLMDERLRGGDTVSRYRISCPAGASSLHVG